MRALLLAFAVLAAAPFQIDSQWTEAKGAHYSIYYQSGYGKDVEFTRLWLERAERLMKDKYGVTPDHYRMSVYLHPVPTEAADVNRAVNHCCTRTDAGLSTGTIDVLTPSAAAWNVSGLKSSLGMAKDDENYHAKIVMSEYIPIGHYAVQDARPSGGWRYYSAPEWFVQGLQEYDAIFHTTSTNRDITGKRLMEWAKSNAGRFSCCSPTLAVTDPYNGGATLMTFLAAQFGENIHVRLLQNSAGSFDAALADETKPYSPAELFDRFRKWLDGVRP